MSKLPNDEAPLQVLRSLAVAIGLDEAITLQELHRIAGGSGAISCNAEILRDWFQFWDDPEIERALKSLARLGYVHLEFSDTEPGLLRIALRGVAS